MLKNIETSTRHLHKGDRYSGIWYHELVQFSCIKNLMQVHASFMKRATRNLQNNYNVCSLVSCVIDIYHVIKQSCMLWTCDTYINILPYLTYVCTLSFFYHFIYYFRPLFILNCIQYIL